MNGFVYCLKNGETNEVLYVGCTKKSINYRLYQHNFNCSNGNNAPIYKYLRSNNISPKIELLEEVPLENLKSSEKEWILRMISSGIDLKNIIYNPSAEAKIQISATVDLDIIEIISLMAKEQQRSFSYMVNILLKEILIKK